MRKIKEVLRLKWDKDLSNRQITRACRKREESPVMATELERIAAKARCEPELRFTLLAHHVTWDRVEKFSLVLEPTKTKLVEFGRFAAGHACKRGGNARSTMYFLGFTLYCTRNRKGNFKVGFRTEKSRLQRSMTYLSDLMRRIRHLPVRVQAFNLNRVLRGHYGYYGIAGNFRALQKVHRFVERYWRKMLNSHSREGSVTWEEFHKIKKRFPLQRPRLKLNHIDFQSFAVL